MIKKGLFTLTAVLVVLTGCGSKGVESDLAGNYSLEEMSSNSGIELANSDGVSLLANNDEDGVFHSVTIKTSDQITTFPWITASNPTYYPTINTADINGDGNKEIVIITTVGTGSGVHIEELHILNSKDLTELQTDEPLMYAQKNIKSSIAIVDGSVKILTQSGAQKLEKTFKEDDAGIWFEEVGFSNHIKYELVNDKIKATLLGSASPAQVVVSAEVDYDQNLKATNLLLTDVED